MPRPPGGFKAELYPLRHRFFHAFGLSGGSTTMNSGWMTLVRSAGKPGVETNPNTTRVNPHSTDVDLETGPACAGMSIIDNLKIVLTFNKSTTDDKLSFKASWTPFFCAFEDKYDAADFDTGTTVASIMQLTKDATNEDVVPLTTNKFDVAGTSDVAIPLSTVNLVEAFDTTYNMTTNAQPEDAPFNEDAFHKLLTFGTNKGALKACLGRTRHFTLSNQHPFKTYFIRKFVPRQIRRIVPFTYFGILINMPLPTEAASLYQGTAVTLVKTHIGCKCLVTYDEWHPDHDQDMT